MVDMYEGTAFHDADPVLIAENNLKDDQAEIDRLRGRQLAWLKMVIRRRGTVRDGYRSLADWTASRLDIPHTVARDLAYLARRLDDDVIDLIRRGHLPFDRTVAEQRLIQAGANASDVAGSVDLDLAGVKKLAAKYRKLSRGDEREAFERQYVNLRVSDDGAVWHLSGRLTATDGQVVRQALDRRADQIPPLASEEDSELSPGQKQAIGLTTMAQYDLDQDLQPGDPAGREPVIMLVKDQTLGDESEDTRGVELSEAPGSAPKRSRRSNAKDAANRSPSRPARSWTPGQPAGRSRSGCAERCSPGTGNASSTPARTATGSKPTTSSPNATVVPTPPTTWRPSAGTTTTSPSIEGDTKSTRTHRHTAADSYHPEPGPNTATPPTSNTTAPTSNNSGPTSNSSTGTTLNNPTPADNHKLDTS